MKTFLVAAATAIIGIWLWILLIQLFIPAPPEPFSQLESCCWVQDQFGRKHYIGPRDERKVLGIPIMEEYR